MSRRDFLATLAATPWLVEQARAEPQNKLPRIGFLGRIPPNFSAEEELRQGLHELGYVEGKDILIEWRHTLGFEEALRPLAVELVQMKVDVIVTVGTPAARAALEATKTIPVVFTAAGDPLATGLTTSLAKPSANGTGVSLLGVETAAKRFDFLHQLSPRIRHVAYVASLANPATAPGLQSIQAEAKSVGIKLTIFNVRNIGDVEPTLRTIPWKGSRRSAHRSRSHFHGRRWQDRRGGARGQIAGHISVARVPRVSRAHVVQCGFPRRNRVLQRNRPVSEIYERVLLFAVQ